MFKKNDYEIAKESRQKNILASMPRILTHFSSSNDYSIWLMNGMELLFGDDDSKTFSAFRYFEFIITERESWLNDLKFIFQNLPENHQSMMRQGCFDCFIGRPIYLEEKNQNKCLPIEIIVAEKYMKLVEYLLRPDQIFPVFENLILKVFPQSQSVFDMALISFRIQSKPCLVGEWDELFCPSVDRVEDRWQNLYSPVVAFGMCNIYPHKAGFFLEEWIPLQEYLQFLVNCQEEDKNKEKFVYLCTKIREAKVLYGV